MHSKWALPYITILIVSWQFLPEHIHFTGDWLLESLYSHFFCFLWLHVSWQFLSLANPLHFLLFWFHCRFLWPHINFLGHWLHNTFWQFCYLDFFLSLNTGAWHCCLLFVWTFLFMHWITSFSSYLGHCTWIHIITQLVNLLSSYISVSLEGQLCCRSSRLYLESHLRLLWGCIKANMRQAAHDR